MCTYRSAGPFNVPLIDQILRVLQHHFEGNLAGNLTLNVRSFLFNNLKYYWLIKLGLVWAFITLIWILDCDCLLNLPSWSAAKLRLMNGGSTGEVSKKTKEMWWSKSSCHWILPHKRAGWLDMKYPLATGGLWSVTKPSNNKSLLKEAFCPKGGSF